MPSAAPNLTIDEELHLLADQLRRLKIEYEIFFNNPSKRPPADIEWRVVNLLRKFSDGSRMSFSQRYRYNEMAQRYAIQSDLWRKKMRIREEGYRRPQDALLSVQGAGGSKAKVAPRKAYGTRTKAEERGFSVQCSDVDREREKVELLYKALNAAKTNAGEEAFDCFDSFVEFMSKKTSAMRKEYQCEAVIYSVETQNGHVKLTAKAKK